MEVARLCIHNGNPIVLGRSVDRKSEFGRPPIRSALIDEGDQFSGCSFGSIADLHTSWHLSFYPPNYSRGATRMPDGAASQIGCERYHPIWGWWSGTVAASHRPMVSPMEAFHLGAAAR